MAVLGALGDLVLALSADTAKFESDLGRAQRMADKFGKEVGKVVGNLAGALLGLGAGGAFGALVKGQIDAADAAGKMAQKLGLTTEAWSEYVVAARLSDVTNEQLQKGFQQLSKNQLEFLQGSKEAAEGFAALGIAQAEVRALNGDTAKLFDLVAGKLAEFDDTANKTAVTMKIFGKSGAELIPLINGLAEAKKEARELGLVYDEQTAKAAEAFNDNLTRGQVALQSYGLAIAKGVLPTLEQLSARMVQTAKDTQSVDQAARVADTGLKLLVTGGTIVAAVFKSVGEWIGGVAAGMVQVGKGEFSQAWETIKNVSADSAENVRNTVTDILETWESTAGKVEARAKRLGKQLSAPAIEAKSNTEKELSAKKKAIDEYLRRVGVLNEEEEERRRASAEALKATGDETQARIAASEAIRRQIDPNREYIEQIERIQELVRQGVVKGGLSPDEGARAIDRVTQEWSKAIHKADEHKELVAETNDIAKELGLTFTSAFEDAALSGKKFGEVIKALGQDIARIIMRKTVTEPVAKAASGFIDKLFGGGGSKGFSADNIIGEMVGGVPLAGGMDRVPFDGFPASLHKNETVLTSAEADQWRAGKSGTTIIQNIAPGVDMRAVQALEQLMRQFAGPGVTERRAVAAVSEARRR